jgi:magnesium-transporting ATPase (P-type)
LPSDQGGAWSIVGDPTEGSLVTLYEKAKTHREESPVDTQMVGTARRAVRGGFDETALPGDFSKPPLDHALPKRIHTIPFDSQYKYMATLVAGNEDETHNTIYIKGAPDKLLCKVETEQTSAGPKKFERPHWDEKITTLAQRGQRVLGAACKKVDKTTRTISHADITDGLTLLGLAGIIDPPRDESIEAVRKCKQAGITVKMITGDHIDTARTIAAQLGIGDGANAIQGRELEPMTPAELEKTVLQYDVFARTSPEHKLKLVEALQSQNIICAMTGDGVNDAPALKKADIGIAMGIKGTDVTKEAAEIVLADDNFSTIVAAVEEGRRVYDNLKKTILFILPTNGAEAFLIIAAILFGTMLPLTPLQILWVNMVTSVTISLALAFERLDPGARRRPPRPAQTPRLDAYFIWRILYVSIFIGGCTLLLSQYLYAQGAHTATGEFIRAYSEEFIRTITLQTIVMAQAFHLFNSRTIRGNAFKYGLFDNKAILIVWSLMLLLQAAITYLPIMNATFGTAPLPLRYWTYPLALGLLVFIAVEAEKALMRQLNKAKDRV